LNHSIVVRLKPEAVGAFIRRSKFSVRCRCSPFPILVLYSRSTLMELRVRMRVAWEFPFSSQSLLLPPDKIPSASSDRMQCQVLALSTGNRCAFPNAPGPSSLDETIRQRAGINEMKTISFVSGGGPMTVCETFLQEATELTERDARTWTLDLGPWTLDCVAAHPPRTRARTRTVLSAFSSMSGREHEDNCRG